MPERCPFCGLEVEPTVDASGLRVCPACRNVGPGAVSYPSGAGAAYGPPSRTEPLAVWALVTGILGAVGFGPVGIAAIVLGVMARRRIRASGGRSQGAGMALAGILTGAVGVLTLVLAAVVFVLVRRLAEG